MAIGCKRAAQAEAGRRADHAGESTCVAHENLAAQTQADRLQPLLSEQSCAHLMCKRCSLAKSAPRIITARAHT